MLAGVAFVGLAHEFVMHTGAIIRHAEHPDVLVPSYQSEVLHPMCPLSCVPFKLPYNIWRKCLLKQRREQQINPNT